MFNDLIIPIHTLELQTNRASIVCSHDATICPSEGCDYCILFIGNSDSYFNLITALRNEDVNNDESYSSKK